MKKVLLILVVLLMVITIAFTGCNCSEDESNTIHDEVSTDSQEEEPAALKGLTEKWFSSQPEENEETSDDSFELEESSKKSSEGKVFTEAPQNPKTPGEIVAAFWFLINDGEKEKAQEIVSTEGLSDFQKDFRAVKDHFADHPLEKIEIESEEIRDNGSNAEVIFTIYDDKLEDVDKHIPAILVVEGGEWKFETLR